MFLAILCGQLFFKQGNFSFLLLIQVEGNEHE